WFREASRSCSGPRQVSLAVRRRGGRMDRGAVSTLVRDTLASYRYEPPPAGSTVGVPWPAEKVYAYVEKLREALVEPYLQRFELRESYEQVIRPEPSYAEFWVVAEGGGGYLEWHDPDSGELG